MAAALFPEAQAKVQAQLDAVVGRGRRKIVRSGAFRELIMSAVPTFNDEGDLPEVTAFFLEASRWRPVASGGRQTYSQQPLDNSHRYP